jgi:hypothetical protein
LLHWDLAHCLLLEADRCFDRLAAYRHRRCDCQDARFARRMIRRRQGFWKLRFRREESLGCLLRSRYPLAIIAARVQLLPPV